MRMDRTDIPQRDWMLGREMVLAAVEPVRCTCRRQSMISPLRFPTEIHREVSELVKDFFLAHAHVDTILVVNSCARGRAVAGSDLDLAVLITPAAASQAVQSLETMWQEFSFTHPLIRQFRDTVVLPKGNGTFFVGRLFRPLGDVAGGPFIF